MPFVMLLSMHSQIEATCALLKAQQGRTKCRPHHYSAATGTDQHSSARHEAAGDALVDNVCTSL